MNLMDLSQSEVLDCIIYCVCAGGVSLGVQRALRRRNLRRRGAAPRSLQPKVTIHLFRHIRPNLFTF